MSLIDRTLLIFGLLSLIVGLVGSVAPVLPGPVLSLIGLLCIQAMPSVQMSVGWLLVFTVLVIASMILDYYLPIRGTKKYGGTKAGVIGSTIGLVVGLFVIPPLGLIIMPCVGAFMGEYFISRLHGKAALRAAWGSFVGFLLGTGYKLIVCGWMLIYGVVAVM